MTGSSQPARSLDSQGGPHPSRLECSAMTPRVHAVGNRAEALIPTSTGPSRARDVARGVAKRAGCRLRRRIGMATLVWVALDLPGPR